MNLQTQVAWTCKALKVQGNIRHKVEQGTKSLEAREQAGIGACETSRARKARRQATRGYTKRARKVESLTKLEVQSKEIKQK